MGQCSSWYPSLSADGDGSKVVSQAGAVVLVRTAERVGLVKGLSKALSPWHKPLATHNPGKIALDLAISVALGGDCAADLSVVRAEAGVFGVVASDPTVSRLITTLAIDAPKALSAIAAARAQARRQAWALAGEHGPDHDIDAQHPLVIDLDATLLDAHSDKQHAAPTWKRGYGFHPLCAFIDHGPEGTGEPAVLALRPGNAGSNTAGDHKAVLAAALEQLPWRPGYRWGGKYWCAPTPVEAPTNSSATATNDGCSTRSDSPSPTTSSQPWTPICASRTGPRHTTPTGRSATGPGWSRPRASPTCPDGHPACG